MPIVLSFDVSSSCIGFAVLNVDIDKKIIKYKDSGYFKPLKTGTIIERLIDSRNKVLDIFTKYNPDLIAIEDIIQFMPGSSTAKTIIMLTTFNRMIGLCSYDFKKKSPKLCSVMSIRHGLKLNKIFPKKEEMPELVAHHLGIKFPYEKNKKNNLKIENYDRADAIAVALYYSFILIGKIKEKKK